MLSKKYRVSSEKDILQTLKRGKAISSAYLTLRYLDNHLPVARFGFVVSKKIHNKSAKRNLPKRRLRSIVARHLSEISTGADYLFLAKPKILELDFQDLEIDVGTLLDKAGALKKI